MIEIVNSLIDKMLPENPVARRFAALSIVVLIAAVFAIWFVSEKLIDYGREQCRSEIVRSDALIQAQTNAAIEAAIKDAKVEWQKWHEQELATAVADAKAQVKYETVIQKIPVVVEKSECKQLGPDALRLFNQAYLTGDDASSL